MGTIATDMTTRSALQSANARASIETTFTRSEVMNSKKLGCGCGGRLPSSIGNDDRAPFPETLGGGDERRRRRRLPRVGRDRWPEKWEGRLGGDCRDRWRGPVGFSSGTEGGERARSMLSVGWSVRERRERDGLLDYIISWKLHTSWAVESPSTAFTKTLVTWKWSLMEEHVSLAFPRLPNFWPLNSGYLRCMGWWFSPSSVHIFQFFFSFLLPWSLIS